MNEDNIVCQCPKCGGNLTKGRYNYECEMCDFKFSQNFFGVEITEELITSICNGETSETFTFEKPDKSWSAKLKYSNEEQRIVFEFDKPKAKVIGKCPICNGNIKETNDYYLCENYKKTCNTLIGKNISGHAVTEEEALKLLNKEVLENLSFTWKSGKTGTADLQLDDEGKVKFIFK